MGELLYGRRRPRVPSHYMAGGRGGSNQAASGRAGDQSLGLQQPVVGAYLAPVRYDGQRARRAGCDDAEGNIRGTDVTGIEHALTQMISTWYLTGGYLGIVLAM